ncbi:hypothetical protein BB561_000125 [Smittium simulii]|uniref:Uncharacterized protein n=1 Tax=Smittium simulii TaxID=133385 RepID=A0A2T9Z0J1_9FUNG|nr:hypothetical protein BB561_000125 [Smittium simulii]
MSNVPSVGQSAAAELSFPPKNRPSIYKEISVKNFLDDSASTNLKQMSLGGSYKRIGCSWHQFSENLEEALNFIKNAIGDSYLEEAEIFVKTPTIYNGRHVDVYKTINYDKVVIIVKIQNFIDTKAGFCKPYDMKVLFKKSDPEAEIPNLLEFENIVVPITYNGSKTQLFLKPKTEKNAKKSFKNNSKKAELSSTKIMEKKINSFFGISGNYPKNNYLVVTSVKASKNGVNLYKNIDALISDCKTQIQSGLNANKL